MTLVTSQAVGAKGDGKTDDTRALQHGLDLVGSAGGGVLSLAPGRYLVEGRLEIPSSVTLQGTAHAPATWQDGRGATLLAVADEGKEDGEPFLTLRTNATLQGISVFHPNQPKSLPPKPYPWAVRGIGDNCSLTDVTLVNPWQAVDFGTHPAGRHLIRDLYGMPLHRGLFIDQCFDIGRVENVHFWPFFSATEPWLTYTSQNAEAFIIGRTDWEYMLNCFCISYRIGYRFIRTKAGSPNVVLTQCGSDVGPNAVRVEDCQGHAGLSWVNSQFMTGVEIAETNTGPVKFTACGFWGIPGTEHHIRTAGKGHLTLTGCHFNGWAQKDRNAACIRASGGGLTVTGCDFMDAGKRQIELGSGVEVALIYGNRLRGGAKITNAIGDAAQIALNAER